MVYSTCSYSYEEDEEIINYLLCNSNAKLLNIPTFKGEFRSPTFKETVHLFPSHFEGEGHYIALIQKPGNLIPTKLESFELARQIQSKGVSKEVNTFLVPGKLPLNFIDLALRPGLFKETKVNGKIIPSHHLSHALNAKNSIELTKEEVVKYVKGETINKKHPDGYFFVSYLGINLGVVYALNNVLKNYYPKGLRFNASINLSF